MIIKMYNKKSKIGEIFENVKFISEEEDCYHIETTKLELQILRKEEYEFKTIK